MNSSLLKTCPSLFLLLILITGCSGDTTTSDYYRETTFKSQESVVAGLVYGYTGKALTAVTGQRGSASHLSQQSGQYAIINYPASGVSENLFYASFNDGSRLYSVWSGVPVATADVTVSFDKLNLVFPSNVNVSPDNFESRANINPITDLAYWYWNYDGKRSPYGYYYYLTSVFQFFQSMYYIPEQDAVHDYPSPELLQLLNEVQIKLSTDGAGFSLISNTTGRNICTATFAQFPICY